jgi:hypothetical protein
MPRPNHKITVRVIGRRDPPAVRYNADERLGRYSQMFRAFRYVAVRLPDAALCTYRLRAFEHEIMRTCWAYWEHEWHRDRNTYWKLEYKCFWSASIVFHN